GSLGRAAGLSNKAVAAREPVRPQTVGNGARFVEHGLGGLLDELRPGGPRKIDDSKVESVMCRRWRGSHPKPRSGGPTGWRGPAVSRPRWEVPLAVAAQHRGSPLPCPGRTLFMLAHALD